MLRRWRELVSGSRVQKLDGTGSLYAEQNIMRRITRPRYRWASAALVAGMVLLAIGFDVARRTAAVKAESVEVPPPRRVQGAIGCMGRVEPASRVRRLAPPETVGTLTLARLMVAEGDRVEGDQLLGWFSARDTRGAAERQAEAELQRSEAELARVKAGAKVGDVAAAEARVARQRAAEANARREWERVVQLSTQKIVAANELDARRMDLAVAEAERRAAEQELASVAEVRPVDVAVAEAQVAQAQVALERARSEIALTELRAPIAGTVLKIYTWPGETVGGQGVLDLADLDEMHVVAEVYETDVSRVRIGQPAAIIMPGSQERLRGEVVATGWQVRKRDLVNTDPVDEIDARVVEVRIRVDAEAAPRLARLSHMRVQVVIGG
jgi:HlyD family secretion protein